MWDFFINLMAQVLETLVGFVGDWGVAIIILTVIVRILLLPLSVKQVESSTKISILQPKLNEIQERYADDPTRMAEEMRTIYSENDFNPVAGCLPMLIQMPIMIGLFNALKLLPSGINFLNIIPDLSKSAAEMFEAHGIGGSIPYIVLVVLFGVLILVPMLMQPGNGDPAQRSSMMISSGIMAVVFTVLGWSLPAAVLLYYDTSSAWGVVQQVLVTNRVRESILANEQARLAAAGPQVNVVRKERKARPKKKS